MESKDPTTKPKGVVSAYSFWRRRGQKKLGEKWTGLDSAAKSPYVHMHEEDKKRHINLTTGRAPFKHMHEEDKKRFAMEMVTDRRHNHLDENEDDEGT